jgi:hypothetical protein
MSTTERPLFGDAQFGAATFTGAAGFTRAAFTGDAQFYGATFTGEAGFNLANFTGDAQFDGATFTVTPSFGPLVCVRQVDRSGVWSAGGDRDRSQCGPLCTHAVGVNGHPAFALRDREPG